MDNKTVQEGKTMAIVAYLWWVGLVIAFVVNNKKRNEFTSFHIRQMIGLLFLSLITTLVYKFVGSDIGYLLTIGSFVLWVIGLIGAFNGEQKEIPLLGDKFQEWFKGIS